MQKVKKSTQNAEQREKQRERGFTQPLDENILPI